MKKVIIGIFTVIGLFIITGCGSSKSTNNVEKTYKTLLDNFIIAYTKPDVELIKTIFPPYYIEYAKDRLTQEYLEEGLNEDKSLFGDDFNVSYEIESSENVSDEDLKQMNDSIKELFNTSETASECVRYYGKIFYKGSNKEESVSLTSFWCCKYGNDWYLVRY